MMVNQLARRTATSPHLVRYYSRIGLLRPARDPHNGYKRFNAADVARLRFIRQAKSLGFTLSEIAEVLDRANRGESPCRRVREIITAHVEENRRQLESMEALQSRMETALERWRAMPDAESDAHMVCHLIESLVEP